MTKAIQDMLKHWDRLDSLLASRARTADRTAALTAARTAAALRVASGRGVSP